MRKGNGWIRMFSEFRSNYAMHLQARRHCCVASSRRPSSSFVAASTSGGGTSLTCASSPMYHPSSLATPAYVNEERLPSYSPHCPLQPALDRRAHNGRKNASIHQLSSGGKAWNICGKKKWPRLGSTISTFLCVSSLVPYVVLSVLLHLPACSFAFFISEDSSCLVCFISR
jgi:hypothetical protein